MAPVRVLIVDDSAIVRRWLRDLLDKEADIEVVAVAATAAMTFTRIEQDHPDVVLLAVELPDMDGIEAVKQIRATSPRLPVILCSSPTDVSAGTNLRALTAGAWECFTKPTASVRPEDHARFASDLLRKIRAVTGRLGSPLPSPLPRARGPRRDAVTALGIGCSTGGPDALAALFQGLPGDLPVPIFIVQHMPPLFTKILADRLTVESAVRVIEAQGGEVVEPGRAYLAPGNYHLAAVKDGTRVRLVIHQDPPENSCRPAVDVLFRSLARVYGHGVLAAVLTGMGQDGSRGAVAIVDAGGTVVAQDEASCVIASMPRAVRRLGIADAEYPIDLIGAELTRRVLARRGAPASAVA